MLRSAGCAIPDVGDLVVYDMGVGSTRWRVTSWLRAAPPPPPPDPRDGPAAALAAELFAGLVAERGHQVRMQFCSRAEATHLGLSGTCGTVAAAAKCRVVGRVTWDEQGTGQARHLAESLGARHQALI